MSKMLPMLCAGIACLSLTGCSLQEGNSEYPGEQCYLNKDNVTKFSCMGNDYTILEDTVSNNGLGTWVGYVRQLVAVDETGKVILQEDLKNGTLQTLAKISDLVDKAPGKSHVLPFVNVYAAPDAGDYLIVDINGEYHKAVIDEDVRDVDRVFDFKDMRQSTGCGFSVNPRDATQILCDGVVYQVTSDTVSDGELGSRIDLLAKNVVFDAETKIPLSKEELREIDWYGETVGRHREQWMYKDVYEINSRERTEAVAVRINDVFYVAKRQ